MYQPKRIDGSVVQSSTQYSASAPTEYPIHPPEYSLVDPSFQQRNQQRHQEQQPMPPVVQHQQPIPSFVQQQPQVQHVVVVQVPFERRPVNTICPSCHSSVVTKVKTEPNVITHIIAGIFCFLCWLPCVCLPYCMESCQSSVHYCPNCAAYMGTYRLGL